MEIIRHQDKVYPAFQASGFAARFAIPFAKEVCKGKGFDIGFCFAEWALVGSYFIDTVLEPPFNDAMNLPFEVDYIFSSHCLEHLESWVKALDHWTDKIKSGGTLFLYLPHYSQTYWRPWHNRKHNHCFTGVEIVDYLNDSGKYCKVFLSGVDLNNSFTIIAEKI